MGIFSVKCPQCGVMLEADEKYIGARAACAECDFHFILPKVTEEVTPVIELCPVNSTQSQTEIAPGLKDQDKVNNVPAPNAKKAGGLISLSSNIKAFRFHPDILEAIVAQRIYLVKDLFSISFEKLSSEFNIGAQKIEAMSILINALRERLQESGNKHITLSSLPLSILLSPLGSKDYPALNEEPDEEHEEKKSFSHNSDQIFQRNLTYSTLTGGLSVPAAQSDFFLDNISSYPQPHKGLPVTIIFEGEKYSANFAEVVSQTSSKIMYQLRWGGRKSAIFNLLQSIFSKAYTQFSLDRRKFGSCNIIMTFFRGTILDEFILKVDISTDTTNPAKDKINVPDSKDITAESVDKNEQIENVGLQKRETPSLDALKHSFEECDEAFFQKKLDWSTLTMGFAVPRKHLSMILSHLSVDLIPGMTHPVHFQVGNKFYCVRINNSLLANKQQPPSVQFLYGLQTPFALMLQEKFASAYKQLKKCHSNRTGITDILVISRGNSLNCFNVDFSFANMPTASGKAANGSKNLNQDKNNTEKHDFYPIPLQNEQAVEHEEVDIEELKTAVCREFRNGFVFNAGAVKLLENILGRACSETEQRELKRIMFKRSDDVYLLPEMVADDETVADMTARIKEYFAEYGCFSLSVLFEEFGYVLKNLTNPDSDFRLFLLKTILPDDGKIFGRLQRQICIPGNISEEEVTQTLAERIREMLQGYGDAVCIDDLDNELPYLNKPALEMILQEHIADAIEIKVDGLSYWKLVEFFCLPDDFAEYLQLTVSSMEEAQTAPSLQTLSEAMEQQYGEGFREIYAVDDDDVFKQIIKVCIADDQYSWNRNVFAKQNAGQELNVADEFLQTQQGIFHESEFFDYASTHRGLTNTGMLILTFLRNKCIRLDQTHWISLKDFDNFSNFSTDMAEAIARELDLLRGSKAFLPLGTLTEAFLSNLPVFTINEQVFYWNHYLLASVAAHKISEVQVINDEPSPYTVTAMTIPQQVKIQGDVIDYIFQDLRKTHCIFSSANDVFEYLRTHQVRMVKTKKLFARIRDFWGVE